MSGVILWQLSASRPDISYIHLDRISCMVYTIKGL